jgi:hypothetical protein
MGLLRRRPRQDIEIFCRGFYDQLFQPITESTALDSSSWKSAFDSIVQADQPLEGVDKDTFYREMTALRIELFGLALSHLLKDRKYSLREIAFTKKYLEEKGQLQVWDIMLEYNRTIARIGSETVKAIPLLEVRASLFKKWTQAGEDTQYATRIANRTGTEVAWDKQITLKHLVTKFGDRLGYKMKLNQEAVARLQKSLFISYISAREAIRSASLEVE